MVDLTQAHKASIELLGTRHTALVEAVRNYVNGSVQPSIDELIAAIEDVTTDIDTREKMLLGLASRQATKPVPSLILDFKTRHYLQGARRPEKGYGIHDLLTVERATPKWVYSASGKLTEVPANEPAYQHDPVTGEPLGLLIEESRTNLITSSDDLTGSDWAQPSISSSAEGGTISATSPAGGRIVTEFDGTSITSEGRVQVEFFTRRADAPMVETNLTASVYALKNTGGVTRIAFFASNPVGISVSVAIDVDSGAVVSKSVNSHNAHYKVEDVGSAWRISLTIEVSEGLFDGDFRFLVSLASATGSPVVSVGNSGKVALWGAQFEEGPTPSSYIPTTDSPVTRAADIVTRTLGDELNPREGVIFSELELSKASVATNPWCAANSSNIRVELSTESLRLSIDLRGAGMRMFHSALRGVSGTNKLAVSYRDGELIAALNGEIEIFNPNQPPFDDIAGFILGNRNGVSNYVNSVFGGFVYHPYALTEQELIDLTS